eukprot:CAMPEP_0172549352 /NCGR_PEP_ID=MMETSP1067-20121228/18473_1 /TAXON_ID=265564 ORGANISM="Thalassiosira punctigera, Strain Tpunct2005C2" /NCGR_SAMPLE_ID=MMETSP1067 /ASSEMBLY_ACC=CAM_ASM_000444 /LENGTH=260 /DNA_ID=CAMNT_0013336731 /DNA_START=183 /DNA_END=965 /DNA_ORIENTATION=+
MAVISSSSSSSSPSDNRDYGEGNDRAAARGKAPGALRSGIRSVDDDDDEARPALEKARDASDPPRGLIIHTHMGDVRIHFTPELAGESSIRYVADVVMAAAARQNNGMGYGTAKTMNGRKVTEGFMCQRCKFYRAEKKLLLQGVVAEESSVPRGKVTLGPCPDPNFVPKSKCPAHDPNCGCHGPVMTRGMVGWAGGGGGPDFFINTFAKPVDWWENQHTVWGEIRDEKSLKVVESTYDLRAHTSGMRMLDEEIEFSLELF